MRDVNGWLMALAFLLGLVLTLGLTVRRVTREVPVTHTVAAGAAGAAGATRAKLTGAAGAVGGLAGAVGDKIEGLLERDPHGAGSVRLAARKDAPAGYSVKFDPSAKRYLAPGDAGYEELETEWWFADEASAEAAGYSRWENFKDKVGDLVDRAGDKVGAAAGAVGAKVSAAADAVGDKIEGLLERDPHGAGSVRLAARKDAPAGYSVKFDPSAKRYLAPGDAGYEELETEWWFADEASAQAAGFVGAAAVVAVPVDEVEAGPFGKGSAKAGPGGSGPAGWLIKGNADSMLYHPPDSPAYQQTIAEVWFFDEETARAAGFDKWDKNFR